MLWLRAGADEEGFMNDFALVVYVYLTENEDDTAVITVSTPSTSYFPSRADSMNIVLHELPQ